MRIVLSVNFTKRTIVIVDQTDFKRGCGIIYDGEMTIASGCEPESCMGIFYTRGTYINEDLKEVPYYHDERLAAIIRTLAKCCEQVTIRFATT